jgi:hypothetical protein
MLVSTCWHNRVKPASKLCEGVDNLMLVPIFSHGSRTHFVLTTVIWGAQSVDVQL